MSFLKEHFVLAVSYAMGMSTGHTAFQHLVHDVPLLSSQMMGVALSQAVAGAVAGYFTAHLMYKN